MEITYICIYRFAQLSSYFRFDENAAISCSAHKLKDLTCHRFFIFFFCAELIVLIQNPGVELWFPVPVDIFCLSGTERNSPSIGCHCSADVFHSSWLTLALIYYLLVVIIGENREGVSFFFLSLIWRGEIFRFY